MVAQIRPVVSVLGGLQDSAGHNPEHLVWPQIWHCFEQDIGLEMLQGPFLSELLSDSLLSDTASSVGWSCMI